MLFRTVLQQESDQSKNFFIPSIYFNSVETERVPYVSLYIFHSLVMMRPPLIVLYGADESSIFLLYVTILPTFCFNLCCLSCPLFAFVYGADECSLP